MKLNKILVAALIAASSASSMAAITSGLNTGNGELMLVLWNPTDKVSYVKDLGILMDSFNGTVDSAVYSLNDSFFASFLAVATTAADTRFAVVASEGLSPRRVFTTIDTSATTSTPMNGSGNVVANNWLDGFIAANNVNTYARGDHGTNPSGNGSSWAQLENGNAYAVTNIARMQNASQAWTNSNFVGTDAVFRSLTNTSNAGGNQAIQSTFEGVWKVQNNAGVYSAVYAVPEADGIAMALAGLGALGFVALRRRQN